LRSVVTGIGPAQIMHRKAPGLWPALPRSRLGETLRIAALATDVGEKLIGDAPQLADVLGQLDPAPRARARKVQ